MNAPLKHPLIEDVLAEACVSISGFKRNPAAVIAEAQTRQVAILNRNRPVAYVIAPHVWEYLNDVLTDMHVEQLALEELERDEPGIEVDLADYI